MEESMLIDREKVIMVFNNYLKGYDNDDPRIMLKIEHTYRVAELCERIAKYLDFTQEDIDLAWLIGMLHDIGRFEQLKKYGTFNDANSINHANYGIEILLENGYIRTFLENSCYDELILTSIKYHNVYVLPDNLDERTKVFCNLIRDADKIDILKVNAEIPLQTIYDFDDEQLKQSVVTKEVMESYLKHQAVNHKLKKSPIDHVVGHLSLVFELVFPISYKIVEEQGYLQQILRFESQNEVAQKQFVRMKQEMKSYITTHINQNNL
jgi:putative nucleotidyltransferase with HDIG domain